MLDNIKKRFKNLMLVLLNQNVLSKKLFASQNLGHTSWWATYNHNFVCLFAGP